MNLFTGKWVAAVGAEPVPLEFKHDVADWAEVCNRTYAQIHPDKPIKPSPAWLRERYDAKERKAA